MDTLLWIILITFISGVVGTGVGGLIGAILGKESSKIVSLLLSFAGGIMLAVVCFDLVPEAIAASDKLYLVILFVGVGYGVIYLLNFLIDHHTNKEIEHIDDEHPKTADDLHELIHENHLRFHREKNHPKNSKYQLFIAGVVMACAIALHNLPEGMVIGSSYATNPKDIISGSGFVLALVIGLHNIPEGMSVSVPLIAGGAKRVKSVILTALSGLPTVIGAILGFYLGMINEVMLTISLSFASGAMLYVVFGELIPESILMWKSKLPAFFLLLGLILGLVLVQI